MADPSNWLLTGSIKMIKALCFEDRNRCVRCLSVVIQINSSTVVVQKLSRSLSVRAKHTKRRAPRPHQHLSVHGNEQGENLRRLTGYWLLRSVCVHNFGGRRQSSLAYHRSWRLPHLGINKPGATSSQLHTSRHLLFLTCASRQDHKG